MITMISRITPTIPGAYVNDAVEEEAREHDIRWIPPSADDEELPE